MGDGEGHAGVAEWRRAREARRSAEQRGSDSRCKGAAPAARWIGSGGEDMAMTREARTARRKLCFFYFSPGPVRAEAGVPHLKVGCGVIRSG